MLSGPGTNRDSEMDSHITEDVWRSEQSDSNRRLDRGPLDRRSHATQRLVDLENNPALQANHSQILALEFKYLPTAVNFKDIVMKK